MPSVLTEDGFRFYFYSNEHRPMHVHVEHGSGEAVFSLEGGVELRRSDGMKMSELRKAEEIVVKHQKMMQERWHGYFK